MRLLITGGCGFIGSAVIRHLIRDTDHSVINVDAMTYAASEDALEGAVHSNRHELIRADIADAAAMKDIFTTRQPDAVMHLSLDRRRRVLWTVPPIRRRSGYRPLPPIRKPNHDEGRTAARAMIADRETAPIKGMPRINDPHVSDSPVDVRGIMR